MKRISTMTVDCEGSKFWRNAEGQLHREDAPAIEHPDGTKYWYRNGLCHREDGPAREYPDDTKTWYRNGLLHREDGPAREYPNGTKSWYRNGKLHREDGPAFEFPDGGKSWYLNDKRSSEKEVRALGKMKPSSTMTVNSEGNKFWKNAEGLLHREDGPAIEYSDGDKYWYLNDLLHREDGPAIEYSDGAKLWYLNGKSSTEEEVRTLRKTMVKSLYDAEFRHTVAAVEIDKAAMIALKDIFADAIAKGYSPREIAHVIHAVVTDAELSAVLKY